MTRGLVTKVVATFGSKWGRIRADNTEIDLFFNSSNLLEPADFELLDVGQVVDFDVHMDHINGAHAERVVIIREPLQASQDLTTAT